MQEGVFRHALEVGLNGASSSRWAPQIDTWLLRRVLTLVVGWDGARDHDGVKQVQEDLAQAAARNRCHLPDCNGKYASP